MPEPVVLVLGGGVGGVVAARTVRESLPAGHRVIVIDREAQASYSPSYHWVMTGDRKAPSLRRERGRLARHGIEFVNAEVLQVDLGDCYVRAGSREFHYDYLVIALGMDAVQGGPMEAHSLETLESAELLAASLRYFSGGRILISAAGQGFRYPPRPYETAMLLEDYFHARRLRQKVSISVYTPEPAPLTLLGPAISDELRNLLAHKGIELETGKCLASVDTTRRTATMADGNQEPFQLLITEPPRTLPAVLRELGLADESGRIPVDPETLETAVPNVFAVGDVTYVTLQGSEPLPSAPGLAEKQAQTAAANIAFRAGRGPRPDPFDARFRWYIETGNGAALAVEGDFLAPQRSFTLRQPSRLWHLASLAQEKYWLWHWY